MRRFGGFVENKQLAVYEAKSEIGGRFTWGLKLQWLVC